MADAISQHEEMPPSDAGGAAEMPAEVDAPVAASAPPADESCLNDAALGEPDAAAHAKHPTPDVEEPVANPAALSEVGAGCEPVDGDHDAAPEEAALSEEAAGDMSGGVQAATDKATASIETAHKAIEKQGPRCFKVKGPLHLGLSLKVGSIYTLPDLEGRCRGDKEKLKKLAAFVKDGVLLIPVAEDPPKEPAAKKVAAKGSKPRKETKREVDDKEGGAAASGNVEAPPAKRARTAPVEAALRRVEQEFQKKLAMERREEKKREREVTRELQATQKRIKRHSLVRAAARKRASLVPAKGKSKGKRKAAAPPARVIEAPAAAPRKSVAQDDPYGGDLTADADNVAVQIPDAVSEQPESEQGVAQVTQSTAVAPALASPDVSHRQKTARRSPLNVVLKEMNQVYDVIDDIKMASPETKDTTEATTSGAIAAASPTRLAASPMRVVTPNGRYEAFDDATPRRKSIADGSEAAAAPDFFMVPQHTKEDAATGAMAAPADASDAAAAGLAAPTTFFQSIARVAGFID